MLHRPADKEIAPGMWANVGGHVEPEEMNDPAAAAMREFYEETGVAPERLHYFTLKGAMLVAQPHRIGLLCHYAADLEQKIEVPGSGDGSFFWVRPEDVAGLPMTPEMRILALHDVRDAKEAILGLAYGKNILQYAWNPMDDGLFLK